MRARTLTGPSSALLVAALLGLVASGCRPADAGEEGDDGPYAGRELLEPVAKPSFTLTNVEDGEPFHFREETDGDVTLLFFGYTHCPDVCPVHMANLAAVLRDLPWEVERQIRVVFVSTDPRRDTPERIREWLSGFDPSFIGLRGTREEVTAVERSVGLPPSVVDTTSTEENYMVAHGAQVLAFTRDDTARVAYPWGTRQRDWLQDLPKLVDEG